jgi:UDP-N-acetylmuramoyl-L-alanyl-D-glutamate--2,6-diaminopimelate ligase
MKNSASSPPLVVRSLPELFARAGLCAIGGPILSATITSLTDDSRSVTSGSCFVAIRGVGRDGHDFVPAAAKSGAAVIVVERDIPAPRGVALVRVADTRVALAKLAAAFYGLRDDAGSPLCVVGVTGTNGKTTVAWLLRSILQAAGYSPAMLGTVEYDLLGERRPAPLTTPGSIELCRHLATAREAGATHAVLEVSSHALDQHRCDGLRFAAGVFTNLTGDHLDYHRTMDAYFSAKRRLFEMLDPSAVAVVNLDDPRGKSLVKSTRASVTTYGIETQMADVRASVGAMDRRGTHFVLHGRTMELPLHTPLIGRHNVLNALAAAATAEAIGVSAEAIRSGLESVSGVPGRLQRAEPPGWPYSVFVDYAHTDDALANVLRTLRPLTTGTLRCVFGCGGDRDRTKRPRMAATVGELADVAYVTSDNPRSEDPHEIIDEILHGFSPSDECSIVVDVDRKRAIESALAEAEAGDTVLIAGKGHETYQLVGDKVLPFDDVEVARKWMDAAVLAEAVA